MRCIPGKNDSNNKINEENTFEGGMKSKVAIIQE
jgi:hypothetical protein